MKSFSISVFLVFLLVSKTMLCQEKGQDYPFINIDNAPKRAISAITQGKDGFVWVGTYGSGVYRYDGIDFKPYKDTWSGKNSLSNSLVYTLYTDDSKNLWAGTERGLNHYDPDEDRFEYVPIGGENAVAVHSIAQVAPGILFLGSYANGGYVLNVKTAETTQIPFRNGANQENILINSMVTDAHGKLYVGTEQGLYTYDPVAQQLVKCRFKTADTLMEVDAPIQTLLLGQDNKLWLGTQDKGLIEVDMSNDLDIMNTHAITSKRILSLIQRPGGKIFAGTENDGLFVLSASGQLLKNYRYGKFDNNQIQANSVWSLFNDENNRIWIGYYNNGIGLYDRYYDKFKDLERVANQDNSLQSGSVTGILKGLKSRFWISMDGGGVDVYDPKKKKFYHLIDQDNPIAKGLNSHDVQTIYFDRAGNFWAGTWNSGIYFLKKGSHSFEHFDTSTGLASNRILSFAENSKGTLWIGTFLKGLMSYSSKTENFSQYSSAPFKEAGIDNCDIRKVLVDQEDFIWLGTTKGLYRLREKVSGGFDVAPFNERMYESRSTNGQVFYVTSLFQDSKENLWIGTDGGGVCKYERDKETFKWFIDDVPKETIASIIEDDQGKIWLGGNHGLSQFNEKTGTIINYTKNDGLLANDFNNNAVFKDQDGTLYFGNYNGINYFKPKDLIINQQQPSLYFSTFKLFNKTIRPETEDSPLSKVITATDSLTLRHDQSVFTIEYASIDFTRPSDNKFAYLLEGFDNTWNYVGNTRSATYTNLPAGSYIFKAKAANNDGIWNENPINLQITILNPWWKRWWAYVIYLISLAGLGYFAFRFINERVREKRLIKYERERRLQEEELHDRKLQFFTNISHEFRTPLTLIKNPIEDIINQGTDQFSAVVREKLGIIYKNTNRLSRLIDELMDFRKLQYDKTSVKALEIELISFCEGIADHFIEEAHQRNILLNVAAETSDLNIWADPGMLDKIIFNILSNAFKATPDNGMVSIHIKECGLPIGFPLIDGDRPVEAVEISIEDTGHGIPEEEVNEIFSRFYQVEQMNRQYYGGTGIGLEVVSSFIKQHKGKIEVTSPSGRGTTFTIFLPLGKGHFAPSELFLGETNIPQQEVPVDLEPKNEDRDKTQQRKSATLLLAEDNTELRTYLKGELQNEYTVVEAINGENALSKALDIMPDIILTDVIMPKMDGFEFCKRIKNDLKTSHIPILMLTAKAQNDDWVTGIDSGADAYLHKPFDMKVLRSQLNQLIKSRQMLFNKYFGDISQVQLSKDSSPLDNEFILKVLKYIHAHIGDADLNVEQLAEELHLSRSQLYRKIKALTGQTANEFLRKVRLQKARELIQKGAKSVSEISYAVGFSSPSYFTKCFKAEFNMLPTEVGS